MPDTLLPEFSRIFQADCRLLQDGGPFLWYSMVGKMIEVRLENDAFV
jgi:hypothetical protein